VAPVPVRHGAAAVLSGAGEVADATAPEALHPALWRAHQLGHRTQPAATPSDFAPLDAELPGGGWPHGMLTELLLPHAGLGELRLLAPALARIAGSGRSVMLFDPPAGLSGWALAQLGVATEQLLVIYGRNGPRGAAYGRDGPRGAAYGRDGPRGAANLRRALPAADLLWALEQSLKSGHVGAVLAWLPQRLRADALRRLQLAAQGHDGPVFLLREIEARLKPSAAPLRLALGCAGIDTLVLRVFKRRGPPLAAPLQLALPPVLTERARARAAARGVPSLRAGEAVPTEDPVRRPATEPVPCSAADHAQPAR
jgi:protein ImuA